MVSQGMAGLEFPRGWNRGYLFKKDRLTVLPESPDILFCSAKNYMEKFTFKKDNSLSMHLLSTQLDKFSQFTKKLQSFCKKAKSLIYFLYHAEG